MALLQLQQQAHIQHATQLEQSLMEGAYNKVLNAKNNVPDQSYLYFMEKLVSTVRYTVILHCSDRLHCTQDAERLSNWACCMHDICNLQAPCQALHKGARASSASIDCL